MGVHQGEESTAAGKEEPDQLRRPDEGGVRQGQRLSLTGVTLTKCKRPPPPPPPPLCSLLYTILPRSERKVFY